MINYCKASLHCTRKEKEVLYFVEQRNDIREVDPVIPVQVKRTDRLVCCNPRHLVEVQHDIGKVKPAVGVEVFIDAVMVRIGGRV